MIFIGNVGDAQAFLRMSLPPTSRPQCQSQAPQSGGNLHCCLRRFLDPPPPLLHHHHILILPHHCRHCQRHRCRYRFHSIRRHPIQTQY